MRNISRWGLVIFLFAVAGFIFYAVGSFTTTSEQTLAVKHFNDGGTWTLKCTRHVTHRSNLFWGFSGKSSERLHFYVITDKGQRKDFTNDDLSDPDDTKYESIPGTEDWVGALATIDELAVFTFDSNGKKKTRDRFEMLGFTKRQSLRGPAFKFSEEGTSIVYATKDGYMKYNYIDKTKSRYEGTLE